MPKRNLDFTSSYDNIVIEHSCPVHNPLINSSSRWKYFRRTTPKTITMRLNTLSRSIALIALLSIGLNTSTLAKENESLEGKAKITRAQAEKTIHKIWHQGKIKSAELEEENGKLVWTFDIATPGTKDIIEAHVDAKTGKVISVDIETAADEEKEATAEAKNAKSKKEIKKSEKEDDGDKEVKKSKKEVKEKKEKKAKAGKDDDDDKDEKK